MQSLQPANSMIGQKELVGLRQIAVASGSALGSLVSTLLCCVFDLRF